MIISSPRGARNVTVHTNKATGSDAIRLTAKQSRKVGMWLGEKKHDKTSLIRVHHWSLLLTPQSTLSTYFVTPLSKHTVQWRTSPQRVMTWSMFHSSWKGLWWLQNVSSVGATVGALCSADRSLAVLPYSQRAHLADISIV